MTQICRVVRGSERRPSPTTVYVGPADPDEVVSVMMVLRRRPDGPPVPGHDFYATVPLDQRGRMSSDDFAEKYGAAPEDIAKVTKFAADQGLAVLKTEPVRRSVVLSGTVQQLDRAFGVTLGRYRHEILGDPGGKPRVETYRGRDGEIHVPDDLADILVGVFGLDNRSVTHRNSSDPPNMGTLTVAQLREFYSFPTNSAAGQVIGIRSEAGYLPTDIDLAFGGRPPIVRDVMIDVGNDGSADGETTQDICIAGLAAPGATIAVYFASPGQDGWMALMHRVVHPEAGDPVCSVFSTSFYISDGDDKASLLMRGATESFLTALSMMFEDAGIQHVTICVASGDTGSNSKVGAGPLGFDGKAHVQYPGSDPNVLAVGGTTIGDVRGSLFEEYVWNDADPADPSHFGTTGGGISDFFKLPPYQSDATVPVSVNDGHSGRGVPDVSANASFNSGYAGLFAGGEPFVGNGTSASAPLWAGLIAVINAALGHNVGFVNPAFYMLGFDEFEGEGSPFRGVDFTDGPADNSNGGVKGYRAGLGWDACKGLGTPNGTTILAGLQGRIGPHPI